MAEKAGKRAGLTEMSKTVKNIFTNILIVLLVYSAVHYYQVRNSPSGVAPEIKGVMLDGQVFNGLSEFEKPVLVHYWATWCKICEFEHSNISRIAEDYPVIGIASQSGSVAEVKAYVEEHGVSYPILVDPHGFNAKQWGIVGFPTSFVIGKDNQIKFVDVGFTSEFGVRARLWLASIF